MNTNTNTETQYNVPFYKNSDFINTIFFIIAFICGAIFIYRMTPNEMDKKFSEIDKINKKIEENIVSCNGLIEESKALASQRDEIVKQVSDALKARASTGMSIVTAKANIPASVPTPESNPDNEHINNVPFNSTN